MFFKKIFLALAVASSSLSAADLELGFILGDPTGLSGKIWTGSSNAIDLGLGWDTHHDHDHDHDNSFHLSADYVWHNFNAINVPSGRLPFYYGVGLRLTSNHDANLGVRIPLGLSYYFSGAPLDLFAELVPVVDLIPDSDVDFDAGIGLRYTFGATGSGGGSKSYRSSSSSSPSGNEGRNEVKKIKKEPAKEVKKESKKEEKLPKVDVGY